MAKRIYNRYGILPREILKEIDFEKCRIIILKTEGYEQTEPIIFIDKATGEHLETTKKHTGTIIGDPSIGLFRLFREFCFSIGIDIITSEVSDSREFVVWEYVLGFECVGEGKRGDIYAIWSDPERSDPFPYFCNEVEPWTADDSHPLDDIPDVSQIEASGKKVKSSEC